MTSPNENAWWEDEEYWDYESDEYRQPMLEKIVAEAERRERVAAFTEAYEELNDIEDKYVEYWLGTKLTELKKV